MTHELDQNERDFISMLADRSPPLADFAKIELETGRTLFSFYTLLVNETELVRGWLIGRLG